MTKNDVSTVVLRKYLIWKKCCMKCGIWNQVKIWSSHLLDNLSNCLMNLKNSGDSTGFEPMTSAMPVQCSNQLSYEVTQFSWLEHCTGIAEVMGSNPVESPEFFRFMRQLLNCPASARIISSLEIFKFMFDHKMFRIYARILNNSGMKDAKCRIHSVMNYSG